MPARKWKLCGIGKNSSLKGCGVACAPNPERKKAVKKKKKSTKRKKNPYFAIDSDVIKNNPRKKARKKRAKKNPYFAIDSDVIKNNPRKKGKKKAVAKTHYTFAGRKSPIYASFRTKVDLGRMRSVWTPFVAVYPVTDGGWSIQVLFPAASKKTRSFYTWSKTKAVAMKRGRTLLKSFLKTWKRGSLAVMNLDGKWKVTHHK